jgi:hypothetical protein
MAEYQGKQVTLNKPFRLPSGSKKKFGVYLKNDKGNVVIVKFGDPNLSIKRDNPERRKAFRARHGCDTDPGAKDKTTAKYWSCKLWDKTPVSDIVEQNKENSMKNKIMEGPGAGVKVEFNNRMYLKFKFGLNKGKTSRVVRSIITREDEEVLLASAYDSVEFETDLSIEAILKGDAYSFDDNRLVVKTKGLIEDYIGDISVKDVENILFNILLEFSSMGIEGYFELHDSYIGKGSTRPVLSISRDPVLTGGLYDIEATLINKRGKAFEEGAFSNDFLYSILEDYFAEDQIPDNRKLKQFCEELQDIFFYNVQDDLSVGIFANKEFIDRFNMLENNNKKNTNNIFKEFLNSEKSVESFIESRINKK